MIVRLLALTARVGMSCHPACVSTAPKGCGRGAAETHSTTMAISNHTHRYTHDRTDAYPHANVSIPCNNTHFLVVQDNTTGERFTFEHRQCNDTNTIGFLDASTYEQHDTDIIIPESVAVYLTTNNYTLAGTSRYTAVDSPVLTLNDLKQ